MVFGFNDDDKKQKEEGAVATNDQNDDQGQSDEQAADAKAALDELNAKEKSDSEDCAFC